jgi:hypothetical protein
MHAVLPSRLVSQEGQATPCCLGQPGSWGLQDNSNTSQCSCYSTARNAEVKIWDSRSFKVAAGACRAAATHAKLVWLAQHGLDCDTFLGSRASAG